MPPSPNHPETGTAPAPRRTRGGLVVVGPTVLARWGPGALLGLPLLAVLLSPFAGAAIQQWRRGRLETGDQWWVLAALGSSWVQLLAGAALIWAVLAVWALVPFILTHQVVLLDEGGGRLVLRRGLRTVERADLSRVVHAVGSAERGPSAEIALRGEGEELLRWSVPQAGWDGPSFDGLRTLQSAAGLRPAPPRTVLLHEARRRRREEVHRELAARAGMTWRAEYAHDEQAFQREFDRVRRVLGSKEPRREGDPRP